MDWFIYDVEHSGISTMDSSRVLGSLVSEEDTSRTAGIHRSKCSGSTAVRTIDHGDLISLFIDSGIYLRKLLLTLLNSRQKAIGWYTIL